LIVVEAFSLLHCYTCINGESDHLLKSDGWTGSGVLSFARWSGRSWKNAPDAVGLSMIRPKCHESDVPGPSARFAKIGAPLCIPDGQLLFKILRV
jgi:hypothetical protein